MLTPRKRGLGSRRGGENKSRGLELVVTRFELRDDSPDGTGRNPPNNRTLGLALASSQELL